jgi:hypothetical protein
MDEGVGPGRWQDDLYDLLRRNVSQFAYVPDAGHRILIDRSLGDPEAHSVALTSEEEGVAMLADADLGGARGVLLMRTSGTGNCVNMLKAGRSVGLTRSTTSATWIRPPAATLSRGALGRSLIPGVALHHVEHR